ncbi:MAG: hypothetical protein J6A83_00355 [Clostridia bacterium]|nr:hypothetical protein [Clostridia bacterium]
MKKLSENEALAHGIHTVHHEMDNGELRFRLVSDHGSSYILTHGTADNGWQKSHVHFVKNEFYIVEDGVIIIALLIENQIKLQRLCRGDLFSVSVGTPHNIFIGDNAILHTVKFGGGDEDWNEYPLLDRLIAKTDITMILKGEPK